MAKHVPWESVACPYCKRGVGESCIDGFGRLMVDPHYSRKGKAMEERSRRNGDKRKKR